MGDRGLVVAVDQRLRGARTIAHNATRLGIARDHATRARRPRRSARSSPPPSFDRVLVDAPCSGLGTLRAHPRFAGGALRTISRRLAARQRRILEAATPLVKPDGLLVYATCTLTEEENEGVVQPWLVGPSRAPA